MTKKSAGRQARDQAAKEAISSQAKWDDLETGYTECAISLVEANSALVNTFKTPGLLDHIPKKKETQACLKGLARDLDHYTTELLIIRETHKGKTGIPKDEQETRDIFTGFEAYIAWQSRYESNIQPNIIFLAEQAGSAHQAMVEAAGINDVNVVTDVVAKEIKPSEAVTVSE